MVGALPVKAIKNVITEPDGDASIILTYEWERQKTPNFDVNPSGYVSELKHAGRRGTLSVVNALLKE